MPYMCMYIYMYEPQYNESTEMQTLGAVIYNAQIIIIILKTLP